MAKTLTGTVTASVNYVYTNARTIASTVESKTVSSETAYSSGSGADQIEIMYSKQYTLTSGSPNQDVDLYNSLEDVFGDTLNFEMVKSLEVRNLSTTAGDDIYVGPLSVSNAFDVPWGGDSAAKSVVRSEGVLLLNAPNDGYAIETDNQVLRLQYQGTSGSISVQIVVLGTTGDLESSSSSSSSSSSLIFSSSSSSEAVSSSSSSDALSSSSSSSPSSSSSEIFSSSSSSSYSSSSQSSISSSSLSSVSISLSSNSSSSSSSVSSQG